MKRIHFLIILIGCMLIGMNQAKAMTVNLRESNIRIAQKPKEFTRTYRFEKREILKTTGTTADLVIDKSDFERHLEEGTQRSFISIENENGSIPMNIGTIDIDGSSAQTWTLPTFTDYSINITELEHVSVASTGFGDVYPEVNKAIKYKESGDYELYALDDDELFFYGYTETDSATQEQSVEDFYIALSPIPLQIGEAYTGFVIFEYSDDPEFDSTVYEQRYDVVGYGTLNLPDGESTQAIKLYFTEFETDYKDGEIVAEGYYEEVVWYSEDGYHVRAGVTADDIWEQEGKTEFDYIDFQSIKDVSKITALEDFTQHKLNLFPNPVAKGQTLNFQTEANFRPNLVELYNIQGQKVGSIPLSGNSNNQFEVGIPQSLTSGVYFYLAYDQKENGLARGKVIIE